MRLSSDFLMLESKDRKRLIFQMNINIRNSNVPGKIITVLLLKLQTVIIFLKELTEQEVVLSQRESHISSWANRDFP